MTKEEADEKVREAKDAVVHAVKRACNLDSPNLQAALAKLSSAEAARAALDKPRLMTPLERVCDHIGEKIPENSRGYHDPRLTPYGGRLVVEKDRADILAQAEKLPRLGMTEAPPGSVWGLWRMKDGEVRLEDAILLSDFRNLIQGT